MIYYYFWLGLLSLRRNPVLTALMIVTLAIGVSASVSSLTILHVMSGDPIPQKSERLYTMILDNGPREGYIPGAEANDDQLTYIDVQNLLASGQGERRSGMYFMVTNVESPRKELGVLSFEGLAASADIFGMFDIPFLYGQGWRAQEDKNSADVVVLSRKASEKIFGKVNPVGQRIKMMKGEYEVVGVMNDWEPSPRFFLSRGHGTFGVGDDFILPFNNAIRRETTHGGGMSCNQKLNPGWQGRLDSECTWLMFWIELKSKADRAEFQSYLDNYTKEQGRLGRFQRQAKNQLFDVHEWMVQTKIVGDDRKLSAWLAFGFLLLCLLNTVGLMLAKFSVRSGEVGVRRALGASKQQIFAQFIIETTVVGCAGSILGVLLAFGILSLLGLQSPQWAAVTHMDFVMLGTTVLMSIAAAVMAGILPTWRACQITPALQLKSQ